ncbi:molybdenum cofactor biosynthesis protein B [Terriglobus sp. RCC_193]|uniref:molybdenum cofactor biosynthesis protein B n=1 Tax=Terriglobus sp. RCC_193 TaxID=3239218 RepID=UPI0035244209
MPEVIFQPIRIAVLTVSDTRSATEDRSGDALVQRLTDGGHLIAARSVVQDEITSIQACLRTWIADAAVDVILTVGGTGITGRDVTPEALRPLFDKELPGFGELFRMLSYSKIGTAAILSRAMGGVSGGKLLFALPGSTNAVLQAWDEILVHQFDRRTRPGNLVALMPRLKEK